MSRRIIWGRRALRELRDISNRDSPASDRIGAAIASYAEHDLVPWGTAWAYFRRWRDDGTLERLHDELRAHVRRAAGRDLRPSAGCIDSQSVKTAEKRGRAAKTLARRFRGASATLSSIPWD